MPPLSAWVREVKYRHQRVLGFDLGRRLGERLAERIATQQPRPARVYIVPVPTSHWHRMKRGIDHPLHIARGAAEVLDATLCRVLWRRHGSSQTALLASERAANAVRGIRLRWGPHAAARGPVWASRLVPGACVWRARGNDLVIVLDDIMTTGATLAASCKRMARGYRRLGRRDLPQVWAAAVAVTPSPEERGRMGGNASVYGE